MMLFKSIKRWWPTPSATVCIDLDLSKLFHLSSSGFRVSGCVWHKPPGSHTFPTNSPQQQVSTSKTTLLLTKGGNSVYIPNLSCQISAPCTDFDVKSEPYNVNGWCYTRLSGKCLLKFFQLSEIQDKENR